MPRHRPGVPAPKAALEWSPLRQLASFRTHPDGQRTQSQADEARKHGRRAGAAGRGRNVSTFGVVWLTAFTGGGLPISWMRPSTASGTLTMTRATMPVGGFPLLLVLCQACCNSLDAWEVGQV